jgi:beta-galactosidase
MDIFRIPKLASLAYRPQQSIEPVLEVTSTMNLGDHPGGQLDDIYVMTNLDEVKLYKNDVYIKTFKPAHKLYPNLPHPPIIIDDLIGETLMKNEKMTFKDAERTKKVLRAVTTYGNHLPLSYKLQMLYILKKYKKTYGDAVNLFYTYMTGWGTKHNTYRFEGYLNGEKVKEVIKEPIIKTDLILEHNGRDLCIEETYDVKRYVLKKVDQNKELLPYANDAFTVEVEGSIELMGPNQLSLMGGAVAFWVKSKQPGLGKMTINHEHFTLIEEVNVNESNT